MSLPKIYHYLFLLLLINVLSSCSSTKQATYFSNASDTTILTRLDDAETLIQKNDMLSVYISSLNPEASAVFNAPNSQATTTSTTTGSASAGGYLVNTDGNIQIPILGNIKAAGLTKKQLKADITNSIID